MIHRFSAILACAALWLSCTFETAPLAVLRGELQATPATAEVPDHLALVWLNYDLRSTHSNWATTQEVPIAGALPYEYTFKVYGPPPQGAMQPNPEAEGQFAIGVLLAYRDTNRNGVLDTIPSGQGPIDQVLGTSAPFHTLEATEFYEVWYVEGTPPSSHPGLQPGFNLFGAAGVVPLDTKIPIRIHPAAVNNLFLCQAIDTDENANMALWNDCLGPGPLRVFATVDWMNGAEDVYVELYSGTGEVPDAQVTVNGTAIPYDAASHAYAASAPGGGILIPGADNVIRVAQTGQQEVPVTVRLDGAFSITSPAAGTAFRWDQPIPLSWSASAGAAEYRVVQNTYFPSGGQNRFFRTKDTSFTIPPFAADPGTSISTRLSARSFHGTWDDNGTDVSSMAYASVSVNYTR